VVLVAWLGCAGASGPAAAQVFSEELRVTGAWPDASLSLGGGIGLDHSLDTNVFGRLRLGALYAYEPLIVNLGITGELGALAQRGVGLELELNHFGGFWAQFGVSRVLDAAFMSHATLGFAIFGIEWQHRHTDRRNDALVFLLRAPIGIFWFLMQDQAERERRSRGESGAKSESESEHR
jgi:hypothetical protein